ncbi:MAG TPA: RecX family transcriptional regulator [bacterium]|nr:RecX family transcriptional regulator [bacterium]
MTSSNSADAGRNACLKQALSLLARRDHFSTELVDKLIEKDFSREEAESALKKLRELRYLDDRRILEAYAAEMKRRRKGFLFFCKKLIEKKARSLFSDRELREAYPVAEERVIAKALAAKMRWERNEARRRLATRGFSADAANG